MAHQHLTVAQLLEHLEGCPPEARIFFGGSEDALTFYRLKRRGDDLIQVEFSQNVYRTESGELVVEDH